MKIPSHQEDSMENLQEISCEMGLRKAGGLDWVMPNIRVLQCQGAAPCMQMLSLLLQPHSFSSQHTSHLLYIKGSFRDSATASQPETGTSTLGLLPRDRASLSGSLAFRELKGIKELTRDKKRAEVQHE